MKTIYILVSAKGGVGKSVVARALVQYFRVTQKTQTAAIDIDVDKWGLSKFYDNENMFTGCDILYPNNKEDVVTKMDEFYDGSDDNAVLILDTPGDLNSELWKTVAMSDVVDSFVEDGAKIVIINIVNNAYECKQSIKQFPTIFGKNTEYVLAYSANLQGKTIDDVELFKGKRFTVPSIVPSAIEWMNQNKYLFYSNLTKPRNALSLKMFESDFRIIVEKELS